MSKIFLLSKSFGVVSNQRSETKILTSSAWSPILVFARRSEARISVQSQKSLHLGRGALFWPSSSGQSRKSAFRAQNLHIWGLEPRFGLRAGVRGQKSWVEGWFEGSPFKFPYLEISHLGKKKPPQPSRGINFPLSLLVPTPVVRKKSQLIPKIFRKACPVYEFSTRETSSGVPQATTLPPLSPPSGPKSMI